jgi:hypothetical protein
VRANVVGLVGGLGNQLFQYAFARWLEKTSHLESRLDLSAYRRRPDYLSLDGVGLRRLRPVRGLGPVPHPLGRLPAVADTVRRLRGPRRVVRERSLATAPSGSELGSPAWYYGYWQFPQIVDEVIDDIRAEVAQAATGRPPDEPIGMHIRRGDMVGHVSVLDPSYFPRALRAAIEANDLPCSTPVAVYSDDPEWCRAELRLPNARYVPPGDAAADLLSLARHRYLVLSGSTFSWWAAQLTDHPPGSVCAPHPFSLVPGQRLEDRSWLAVPRDDGTSVP